MDALPAPLMYPCYASDGERFVAAGGLRGGEGEQGMSEEIVVLDSLGVVWR